MVDQLRAATWDEFVGQAHLKERLEVHIVAALAEGRPLEHIMLTGPPGFGKTSLATIIADRMKVELTSFTMPMNEQALKKMVMFAEGVILLDEIHRASKKEQEMLLPLLEFGYVQGRNGQQYVPFQDEGFTLVGATTERDKVIDPLYDRFAIKPDFDEYTDDEMTQIVMGMAKKAKLEVDSKVASELGRATGGTPRVARQFILTVRDYEIARGKKASSSDVLNLCRVTPDGLSKTHLDYLGILRDNGISGLRTLQTHLRVNENTVRELERLLVRNNLITLSERGRELTPGGVKAAIP